MIFLPKIASFKDLLLWPIRFVFNLPLQWQAMLGLLLTAPLLLIVLFQGNGNGANIEIESKEMGYIKLGALDSNTDSVRVDRHQTIRLMARQGQLFWAETTDGRHRGFIPANAVTDNPHDIKLPEREAMSSFYISRQKFDSLMANPATTFSSIEKNYIHAEYIHPVKNGFKAEFGFYIVEHDASQSRPAITFNPDSTIKTVETERWRSPKGLSGFEQVEIIAPLINTGEFDQYNPYTSSSTGLIWGYLIGYVPLFIFMIVLWLRWPLYWMPNVVANLIAYGLCATGPIFWCSVLLVKGVPAFPLVLITAALVFVGIIFFWIFNSGLRCPRCKILHDHTYVSTFKGIPFSKSHVDKRNTGSEILEDKSLSSSFEYVKVDGYDSPKKEYVTRHRLKVRLFYDFYKVTQTVRIITDTYVCENCQHGKQECREEILNTEEEFMNNGSEIEYREVYTIGNSNKYLTKL